MVRTQTVHEAETLSITRNWLVAVSRDFQNHTNLIPFEMNFPEFSNSAQIPSIYRWSARANAG